MDAQGRTLFERGVARAMKSALGVGASRFHTGGAAGEADTVYLGAFRKRHSLQQGVSMSDLRVHKIGNSITDCARLEERFISIHGSL